MRTDLISKELQGYLDIQIMTGIFRQSNNDRVIWERYLNNFTLVNRRANISNGVHDDVVCRRRKLIKLVSQQDKRCS